MGEGRRRAWRRRGANLGVIAAGGVLGAEARFALTRLQEAPSGVPWTVLAVNVVGCLLIGVLMTTLLELTAPHRLLRPFLGIGVLGGFTTFSTYAVDVTVLLDRGRGAVALAYLVVTPMLALVAVWVGSRGARTVISRRRRHPR